jgi:glycosyltransferase involved in cell wall biosynthesis
VPPRNPDPLVPAGWPFVVRERRRQRSILFIDDQIPQYDRNAGDRTVYEYMRLMIGAGYKTAFIPHNGLGVEPYLTQLRSLGTEVLTGADSPGKWLGINGPYLDSAWIGRPEVAQVWVNRVRDASKARIAYYTHDLHHVREQRRFEATGDPEAAAESSKWLAIERDIFASVDAVLTPSDEERPVIAELAPFKPVAVIPPFILDLDARSSPARADIDGRSTLVFIGGFGHSPNTDAVLYLANDLMPRIWRDRPDATLVAIGPDPTPEISALANERFQILGYVPELEPYLRVARMTVSPLRFGAGVKGKIISSLQAGVPVVTTSIGNEGIDLRDREEALVADSAEAFAAACVELMGDDELWRKLSDSGRTFVAERYSADSARRALEAILDGASGPASGADRTSGAVAGASTANPA